MVFGEILIDGVFAAALLVAVACFVYLVYATILERRLLRTPQTPGRAKATRRVSSAASALPRAALAEWQRGAKSSVLPEGRS
jgi:hypothetical protein